MKTHAQSLAELAVKTAELDLTDPSQLILVNINLGAMAALAKIILKDDAKECGAV